MCEFFGVRRSRMSLKWAKWQIISLPRLSLIFFSCCCCCALLKCNHKALSTPHQFELTHGKHTIIKSERAHESRSPAGHLFFKRELRNFRSYARHGVCVFKRWNAAFARCLMLVANGEEQEITMTARLPRHLENTSNALPLGILKDVEHLQRWSRMKNAFSDFGAK